MGQVNNLLNLKPELYVEENKKYDLEIIYVCAVYIRKVVGD